MKWEFDEDRQLYVDEDGNALTESALLALISLLAGKVGTRLTRLITADREGDMDTRAQQKRASREITMAHRMMAALGAGGLKQLTEGQKREADQKVRREETYWLRLTMGVNTATDEEAKARAAQYGSSTYGSFQAASKDAHARNGWEYAEWQLEHGAAHCDDCPEQASRGRRRVEDFPDIGSLACLSNCRCNLNYFTEPA